MSKARKFSVNCMIALGALAWSLTAPAQVIDESELRGKSVLFVTGGDENSAASDDGLIVEALQARGLEVELATATDPADTAADHDAILISSTADHRVLGDRYANSSVPIMTWNAYSYADLSMTGRRLHEDFSVVRESVQHQENHANFYAWSVNEGHELSAAAGLRDGLFLAIFFAGETDMNWGRPSAGADRLVVFKGDPKQAALFTYEKGAVMAGLKPAPARRVGIFLGNDTFHQLSDAQGPAMMDEKERAWFAGKRLFFAAVRWTLSPPPAVEKDTDTLNANLRGDAKGKKVLFVRRFDLPWPAGEASVPQHVAHLESLGFEVTVHDHMESDEIAADFDLVIVSAAINKFKFANKYADAPVPVLLLESKNVDGMKLVGPNRTIEYGTNDHKDSLFPPENFVRIVRPDHPLSGPFFADTMQIYDSPAVMGWSIPSPAAVVMATVPYQPDHAAVWGYEAGATMAFNAVAPARRAVFPLDFPMFARLTEDGLTLYNAVLHWLISD